jgi:sec-independent protein translocase protein TatA
MFGLGTQEMIIILVLVLMVFGAGKLPQVGSALGKGLRNLREGLKEVTEEREEESEPSAPERKKE